jgi:hypothetical protein
MTEEKYRPEGRARAITVQVVVDAALHVHDQRNRDHHQIEFLAKIFLVVVLQRKEGHLRFLGRQERPVVLRENFLQPVMAADTRPGPRSCLPW